MEQSAIKIGKQLKAEYWAVSSKTGKNIHSLFYRIAALTFNKYMTDELLHGDSIQKEIASDVVCKFSLLFIRKNVIFIFVLAFKKHINKNRGEQQKCLSHCSS